MANPPKAQTFDVVIVGGGLVGTSLACALGQSNLSVALIDAAPWQIQQSHANDVRSIALAKASIQILTHLGLWQTLRAGSHPITNIKVSDRGHFAKARFRASDYELDSFGHVVEIPVLQAAFNEQLKNLSNCKVYKPATVEAFTRAEDACQLTIVQGDAREEIHARCVVAADGTHSFIRSELDIKTSVTEYNHTAIVTNVVSTHDHEGTAFERFTDTGPLALLPLKPCQSTVIYTVTDSDAPQLQQAPEAEFLAKLQARFGDSLGVFTKVGKRVLYPLKRLLAQTDVAGNVVLLGNSAHTLHPIGAQGFNLGLRDVAVLADCLSACDFASGLSQALTDYQTARKADHARILKLTDRLISVFCNDWLPSAVARNWALMGLNALPPLKQQFVYRAMGYGATKASALLGDTSQK